MAKKNRGGRPKKIISKQQFEQLCAIQCTEAECCAFFQCDVKTLQRWVKMTYGMLFRDVYEEKRGIGKISLRRSLFQRAQDKDGPPAIAIFMAKNHLGMADKIENVVKTDGASRLIIDFGDKEKE